MTYKIERDLDSSELVLLKDSTKVEELVAGESLKITFILQNREQSIDFYTLESFMKALGESESLASTNLYFIKDRIKSRILYSNVKDTFKLSKINYRMSYEKELTEIFSGFSDYSYVNYFLPKWSTAYNFEQSNHTKTMESLFTDLKLNSVFVENLIKNKNDPEIEKYSSNINKQEFTEEIYSISQEALDGFIDQDYTLGSRVKIDFKRGFGDVYITRVSTMGITLKISGLSNNTFVNETIVIEENESIKLKMSYDSIYDISVVDFLDISDSLDYASLQVNVTNCLDLKAKGGVVFRDRRNKPDFEIESTNLVYKTDRKTTIFNIGDISDLHFSYIDSLDNIYILKENTLYYGRVDARLDLQIPRDITYNNTKYIETTYLNSSEYLVEVLLVNYLEDTSKNLVSISVKDSLSNIYYLNSNSQLQVSDEELFIDISGLKKEKISFELTMNSDIEYIIITVNDYQGHHKKSNIIIHPKINLTEMLTLLPEEKVVLLGDKLHILNTNNLTIRESKYV